MRFLCRYLCVVKWKTKLGGPWHINRDRLCIKGAYEIFDPEVLVGRMDFWDGRIGIDGFEADPELADLRQVIRLCPLAYTTNTADITLVKWPTIVPNL